MNTKLLLSLLVLGLGVSSLAAQPADLPPPPEAGMRRDGSGPRPTPPFELNADQKARLDTMRRETAEKVKAVRDDTSLSAEQKKEKIGELMKTSRAAYAALLTPEQRAKVDAFRKEHPGQMKMELIKADVASRLGLSTEQVDKIRAIEKSAHEQVAAVLTPEQQKQLDGMKERFGDRKRGPQGGWEGPARRGPVAMLPKLNLTEEQKIQAQEIRKETAGQVKAVRDDAALSKEQKRKKIGELHKAGQEKFRALLTPDQLKQLPEGPDGAKRFGPPGGPRGSRDYDGDK